MLSAYRAVLRGHVLEWRNERPKHLAQDQAVDVHVTILEEAPSPSGVEQGPRMAAALERLAQMQAPATPPDPVGWERKMRRDRVLPVSQAVLEQAVELHGRIVRVQPVRRRRKRNRHRTGLA
jgi:hypothetical protein